MDTFKEAMGLLMYPGGIQIEKYRGRAQNVVDKRKMRATVL